MKQNINSVEIHPPLSHNGHPVDDALMSAGILWPHLFIEQRLVHDGHLLSSPFSHVMHVSTVEPAWAFMCGFSAVECSAKPPVVWDYTITPP